MYFDKIKLLLLRRLIAIVVMHRWVLHRHIVQGNEFRSTLVFYSRLHPIFNLFKP